MTDVFTKKKRSEIMSHIRASNTGIEKKVYSYLRREGIYFQKHYPRAPGRPDIALPARKVAVFINGDFWHGYGFAGWKKRIPKTYWYEKIRKNIARDRQNYRRLRLQGWRLMKIWEHEIEKEPEQTFKKIAEFLKRR